MQFINEHDIILLKKNLNNDGYFNNIILMKYFFEYLFKYGLYFDGSLKYEKKSLFYSLIKYSCYLYYVCEYINYDKFAVLI